MTLNESRAPVSLFARITDQSVIAPQACSAVHFERLIESKLGPGNGCSAGFPGGQVTDDSWASDDQVMGERRGLLSTSDDITLP